MRSLDPDYSKKMLHIAVATMPAKWEWEDELMIHGIIFDPRKVFSDVSSGAEWDFFETFAPGQIYRTVVIETEMGPCELVRILGPKFGLSSGLWIVGIINSFSIDPGRVDEMLRDLLLNAESYASFEGSFVL